MTGYKNTLLEALISQISDRQIYCLEPIISAFVILLSCCIARVVFVSNLYSISYHRGCHSTSHEKLHCFLPDNVCVCGLSFNLQSVICFFWAKGGKQSNTIMEIAYIHGVVKCSHCFMFMIVKYLMQNE